ncbi:hypothetical protein Dsin_012949 [Dipteronia sinensis]|uniref:Uncharacterized protein n=1 Tax=Dipteronia sinensis TaxID=43782 RepID=A0AAE0E8N2_9ROSI|nr:hypothetical protein Dsin_012949 [Dipteronia sinensis]
MEHWFRATKARNFKHDQEEQNHSREQNDAVVSIWDYNCLKIYNKNKTKKTVWISKISRWHKKNHFFYNLDENYKIENSPNCNISSSCFPPLSTTGASLASSVLS